MKLQKNKNGHLWIQVCVNSKKKNLYVHQLVAKAFIPNTNNASKVRHKDGNKSNNNVNNLKWYGKLCKKTSSPKQVEKSASGSGENSEEGIIWKRETILSQAPNLDISKSTEKVQRLDENGHEHFLAEM